MGPSHIFVLLLAFSACTHGMLPQGNVDFSSLMSGGGFTGGISPVSPAGTLRGMSQGGFPRNMPQSVFNGGMPHAGLPGSMSQSGFPGGVSPAGMGMSGGSLMGAGRSGAMLAMQYPMYERKRKLLKNLVKLYEKHGCEDPMQKFSSEFLPAAITMINGCSNSRANISCRQYGIQKVNIQNVLMQNSMSATQQSLISGRLQNMSPYISLQDYILGTVPQSQMNPVKFRMTYGNEGPGSGQAFTSERMDTLKNWRMRFLPYQCQDIQWGTLQMGLCCPGPVTFDPRIEMRAMADLIHV